MSLLNGLVNCRAIMFSGDVYISGRDHNWKLKFSLQTQLTHKNTNFEYIHASVELDNVDVSYLEAFSVPKNKSATTFLVCAVCCL